jgi:hypothetical protein
MLLKIVGFFVLLQAISTFTLPTNIVHDAEELENEFQGDMIISEKDLAAFNGRIDVNLRWPNNIVPYFINTTFFSKFKFKL